MSRIGELTPEETVLLLAPEVYEYSAVGGNLHIVLDDYNIEDSHILWCLTDAIPQNIHEATPFMCWVETQLAHALLAIPEAGRESLIKKALRRRS